MKKLFSVIYIILIAATAALTACGQSPATSNTAGRPDGEGVDVDLTVLSSTMVYAQMDNVMKNPENYIGKTFKVSGPYSASYYDATELYYHYVIIKDATACCAQGIEFILSGGYIYPDDYPEDGTEIEITGVFSVYDELGLTYYYLAADGIVIV